MISITSAASSKETTLMATLLMIPAEDFVPADLATLRLRYHVERSRLFVLDRLAPPRRWTPPGCAGVAFTIPILAADGQE
jgi:hypothetical protein